MNVKKTKDETADEMLDQQLGYILNIISEVRAHIVIYFETHVSHPFMLDALSSLQTSLEIPITILADNFKNDVN